MDSEGSNDDNSRNIIADVPDAIEVSIGDAIVVIPSVDENNAANTNNAQNDSVVVVDIESEAESTPNRKKRKRSPSKKGATPKKIIEALNDDDDDGQTCSICLDSWEWSGPHRLVCLKCGHLFGESCIRRWMQECANVQSRCCPTCKTKAALKDIRILFAKKIVTIDKSEEYRLQDAVEAEKARNVELQNTVGTLKLEMAVLKEKYVMLESKMDYARMHGVFQEQPQTSSERENAYRISLEKNIDINGACRAMVYSRRKQTLIVSQKSNMPLFPGYGVRFISAYNLQPTNVFFRMASKAIRDLSLDSNEELIAAAASDKSAYLYSVTNHTAVASVTPSEANLWSVAFDKTRPMCLYLGSQTGNTYVYDIRQTEGFIEQCSTPGDFSPVIGISSIPVSEDFRFGGFIVCKLQSLWFYEYTNSQRIEQTKLAVEGPFVSINFDEQSKLLLVAARANTKSPNARYIVGKLQKIDHTVIFRDLLTVAGAKVQPVMTRSTQIKMANDTLIAAYLQDTNSVTTWNSKSGNKYQGFNINDCILDMCPMYVNNRTYLATLSETKCRIFQVNSV